MDRRHHNRHRHHSPPPPPPPQVTHVHHTSHHPPPPPHVTHVHHTSHHPPSPPHVTPVHHPTPPPPPVIHHPTPPPPPQPHHHTAPHNVYPPPPAAPAHLPGASVHPTPPPPQPHHHTAPHNVYPPPPAAPAHLPGASVHHVSHTTPTPHLPHVPSVVPHHHGSLANRPSVRVLCKAKTDYSLTIRNGKVILAPNNNSDPHQHWIKDEKYGTRVKDAEGFPSFALINKATGQAMKHSIGATHPVQLIPYNANHLDESILWTESKDLGDSYKAIRMVNNIRLNVDALDGDKQHGGVFDGTKIVLWEWKKGENQRWKIVPY